MLYWFVRLALASWIFTLAFRPHVKGRKNLPRRGPVILASNHLSYFDSVIVPGVLYRHIYYLTASTYFRRRSLSSRFLAWFLRNVGMIPLDRSGGRASEASLRAGLKVLGKGHVLGIYPEGSRSVDGKMHRGRTGVARLALESGVKVVPVAMIDTDQVMPIDGGTRPRFKTVHIEIGKPLDFSRYAGRQADRDVLRQITDEIMEAIRAMSGQEYVDAYGASRSRDAHDD